MTEISVNDFDKQSECIYDGERYSVRDNGAVLRHSRLGKSQRPTDDKWTFGNPSTKTGYMEIASVRVHRIVATAFHGDPPTKEYVVDHMDTNRRNNRPENLRWLTRLENALLNPITVARIEFICGSIETFLNDPSTLRNGTLDRNFEWMRTVSVEEGIATLQRLQALSKTKRNKPSKGGKLGEWVFKPNPFEARPIKEEKESLVMALTPGAAQRNWVTPTEFSCCPLEQADEPLSSYAQQLKEGETFSRNHFSESIVLKIALAEDRKSLWVMCIQRNENAMKPWSLAQITIEKDQFVHTNIGSFFEEEGAEKQFCLAQGLEWTGRESIDDYC